ncbi:MAG: MBL fold metallo-hydrolase [Synergistaceae bacterium]|nr:MBL fold metallo-hydrolase [Synergistaceae bacterium]
MNKIFVVSLIVALMFVSVAFAESIEVVSLLETQGKADPSLLIGMERKEKLDSQILAFYVKIPGREILFDTGLRNGNIVKRLAENGVKPEDVKIILLTHLHPDHFGGLVNAEGQAAFPNAEIFVGRVERDYWINTVKNEKVIEALNLYEAKLNLFDFGDEVFDGVKALDASGHTPGHTVFDVTIDGEKLLVVGDIVHFIDVQLPSPDVSVKYDVDPGKARETRKAILDYAVDTNAKIAGMHITPPGLIKVRKTATGYEKY